MKTPPAVLLAMGNWFSDKYAEGTTGRRFYAGCRNVDTVESIAAEHAREQALAREAGLDMAVRRAGATLAQTAPAAAADTLFRATTLSLSASGDRYTRRPKRPA